MAHTSDSVNFQGEKWASFFHNSREQVATHFTQGSHFKYLKAFSILLAVFLAIGDFKILIIVILNPLFDHFNTGIISKSSRVDCFGS